ncbi:MAG: sigma-70 family RNA polymerase sigma factor [Filimonas sp.]|nr:sigma-70 family RNA polymerase sigma factor [Filimonas sp.]
MSGALSVYKNVADKSKRNITQVINAYSKRLLGFIRKRVSNEADAEDILQDVFFQFVDNSQPIEQLTAWLFTVARNRITDSQRKQKPDLLEDTLGTGEEDGSLAWTELLLDNEADPESQYLRSLIWEELDRALNELPEEQRQVFVWNELENIPFKEIAEKTGVAINTLISRKRYAVLHLRERLQTLRDELINY